MRPLKYEDVETHVERTCPTGHPAVVRCYPLRRVDGRLEPFPTLFWLVCPSLADELSRIEAAGGIRRIERAIGRDATLAGGVRADHRAYIAERWSLIRADDRDRVRGTPLAASLLDRGIGGLSTFARVKCLHVHYAHHLARGAMIGSWFEEHDSAPRCSISTTASRTSLHSAIGGGR